jgi:hypothetical protein
MQTFKGRGPKCLKCNGEGSVQIIDPRAQQTETKPCPNGCKAVDLEAGPYVLAAPALAWKRYALALEAMREEGDWATDEMRVEEKSAHAALVALGEVSE